MKISVIYSCFNEDNNQLFKKGIEYYSSIKDKYNLEIICVDGGSNDDTVNFLRQFPVKIIQSEKKNRSERFNEGANIAKGEIFILQHPRSLLANTAIEEVLSNINFFSWGVFTHQFDNSHPILKFTSWYSNFIRGDIFKIYYLDHCYFIKKDLYMKVNGFPAIAIFEDTEFCKKLNKLQTPIRLKSLSTTSAIRFLKNGIFKQALMNQWMKLNYYLFFKPENMNDLYEKNTNLNKKV